MTDLLRNFAYCSLTAPVNGTTTSFLVDEVGRLPTAAQLQANEFWMTVESTYAEGSFEIVRVIDKDATSGAGTLTVVRGQEGTTATTHIAGTYLKAALTAAIAFRLGPQQRQTASYTTASLAAKATENGTINLAVGYRLLRIQTSVPARVRLYANAAARTADALRIAGTDPLADGVVLDYVTTDAAVHDLSPLVDGVNTESTPSTAIPIAVSPTSAGAVTVTLTYARTE